MPPPIRIEDEVPARLGRVAAVAALCVATASVASVALYRDMIASGGKGMGEALAVVERRESRVRRKPASSYVWSHVETNENLYRRDSVQTSEASAASVRLKDGTMLELGENSLVVLDELANLQLGFGSAVVRRASGQDSRISIGKDGKAQVDELAVRLVRPRPLGRVWAPGGGAGEVAFRWTVREGVGVPVEAQLQLASDPAFTQSYSQAVTTVPGDGGTRVTLPPGRHYWRLVDSGGRPLTETARFQVTSLDAPRGLGPTPGERVALWGEEAPVVFRWSPLREAEGIALRLEVFGGVEPGGSRADEGSVPLLSEPVTATAGTATFRRPWAEGALRWRLVAEAEGMRAASRPIAFTAERGAKLRLELSHPPEDAAIEKVPEVRFAWGAETAPGLEYVLEIKRAVEPGGLRVKEQAPLKTVRGRALTQAWKAPVAGKYAWRVHALLGESIVGEAPWRSFSIFEGKPVALVSPAQGAAIHFWENPEPFTFEWEPDELVSSGEGTRYRLEVASDRELQNRLGDLLLDGSSVASERLAGITDGTYFWRVRVVDPSGRAIKASEVRRFAYGVHPPVRAPASMGAAPASGAVLDLSQLEGDPVLSWPGVEGARAYELTLLRDEGPEKKPTVLSTRETPEPTATLSGLGEGRYLWSVRSVDRLSRRGPPMPPRRLTLTLGEALVAPEIVSPEVQ